LAGLGILVGLLAAPCGQAQGTWTQAYGNAANTSFVNATTNLPVAPRWAFQLDGPVSAGGPAVSPNKDGRVYVATAVGTVWGFNANGDFHCSHAYKGTTITSTPAILPNGDLAILITRPVGDDHQTSLARLTADCGEVWQVDLPVWTPGYTSTASGSVKIWTLNGTSFLFVHGRYTTNVNVLSHDPESFNELLVYDETGQIFARRQTGNWCIDIEGGGTQESLGDVWDVLTSFWPTVGTVPPLYQSYGWPDPSPAIMDSEIRGVSSPSSPVIAVTDHDCAVSLDVFRFDPGAAAGGDRLVKLWGTQVEGDGTLLSSPAITPEGLIAFGTSGHRVRVYDAATRELKWSYDTKYPVMHPPAMAPDAWIVRSDYLVHFLKPNSGGLLTTARPQPFPTGGALGGLATSVNEVVVPHFGELGIWTHDLHGLTHALTNEHFRTSCPALTAEGRLYVVAQTNELSVLFAFGPP
jgi:hypothetical protein